MRVLAILSELVRRSNHLLTYVFRQGSWSVLAHESAVLNAALSKMDDETRTSIERQLGQSCFIERMPDGRINIFRFYGPKDGLRVPKPEFADLLIKVKLRVDEKQQIAHVTFYKGYLFSVEFKKPSRFFVGKDLVVGEVEIGRLRQSYTQEIDRFEHGKPK